MYNFTMYRQRGVTTDRPTYTITKCITTHKTVLLAHYRAHYNRIQCTKHYYTKSHNTDHSRRDIATLQATVQMTDEMVPSDRLY